MIQQSFEKKIINLINKYRLKGFNDYQIKLALIRQHYPSNTIDHLLKTAVPHKKKDHNFNILFTIVAIVLIIPLISFASYKIFTPKYEECTNIFCFTVLANKCENAKYSANVGGINFIFKTSNCELIKEVKDLSQDENNNEFKLLGKSMKCKFNRDEFPQKLITTMSESLEYCNGNLKDTVLSLEQ